MRLVFCVRTLPYFKRAISFLKKRERKKTQQAFCSCLGHQCHKQSVSRNALLIATAERFKICGSTTRHPYLNKLPYTPTAEAILIGPLSLFTLLPHSNLVLHIPLTAFVGNIQKPLTWTTRHLFHPRENTWRCPKQACLLLYLRYKLITNKHKSPCVQNA